MKTKWKHITFCCKDCGAKIHWSAALYGKGRCRLCSLQGNHHPMFGKHHSKKSKLKISKSAKGRKISKETSKKLSKARIGNTNALGYRHSKAAIEKIRRTSTGRKHSEETKRKLSESRKGKRGSNWLGGISFLPYSLDWTKDLKIKIRNRDNHKCRVCNKSSKRNLSVYHIDYDKQNCKEDNLISLCDACHLLTNYNRDYWFAYCRYLIDNLQVV